MASKNANRIREGSILGDVIVYLVVGMLCFVALYPMYYVLVISLSDPIYASTLGVYWWPKSESGMFYLGAYERLVTDTNMWVAYGNTVIYTVLPTLFMIITCAICAYPLTSPKLIGRKFYNFFLLIPMYFSGGLIPTFILTVSYTHLTLPTKRIV